MKDNGEKLKACPFCGYNQAQKGKDGFIWCPNCDARGPDDADAWDESLTAEEAWNIRTPTEDVGGEETVGNIPTFRHVDCCDNCEHYSASGDDNGICQCYDQGTHSSGICAVWTPKPTAQEDGEEIEKQRAYAEHPGPDEFENWADKIANLQAKLAEKEKRIEELEKKLWLWEKS